jgi:hypothetical protein
MKDERDSSTGSSFSGIYKNLLNKVSSMFVTAQCISIRSCQSVQKIAFDNQLGRSKILVNELNM